MEFLAAKKSPETLKAFVNTVLAELWEEKHETPMDERALWNRCEPFEAEVLDAGALLCLVPGSRALLDAFACEGKAPARVLSPRCFERCHGICIERHPTAVARLRRAVIEPGDFSG